MVAFGQSRHPPGHRWTSPTCDPSTHRFEVTYYADDETDRGMLLPIDGSSIEAAIAVAEQHYAKR
jgi:hypothetical protein